VRARPQIVLAILLGALAALIGCGDESSSEVIAPPRRHVERFIDLENEELTGQGELVFYVTVLPEPEIVHPHFEGRWTFSDIEKPIDFFVIPAASYVVGQPPASQRDIYWSSIQDAQVGQQRAPRMEIHPPPGDWVIVLYNALPFGPTTRARFSTEIELTYFR
jgi:hypothetical protein